MSWVLALARGTKLLRSETSYDVSSSVSLAFIGADAPAQKKPLTDQNVPGQSRYSNNGESQQ